MLRPNAMQANATDGIYERTTVPPGATLECGHLAGNGRAARSTDRICHSCMRAKVEHRTP